MAAGSVLSRQREAFMLFAFGKLLGWWRVLDPCGELGLGKNDAAAVDMVRDGYVAIHGYAPAELSIA